ncbi:MAG: cell division protein [Leptospiraceae bacterium]|nr:MAG: cell division protein [Leptospiraceae bacterium]
MKKYLEYDLIFLLLLFILIISGTWFLFSSSSIIAYHQFNDVFYFSHKQIQWHFIGILCMLIALIIPIDLLKKYNKIIVYLSIGFMFLVFLPGIGKSVSSSNSFDFKRWIQIGSFTLQPSEFVKISFLLYLANLLETFNYKEHFKHYILDFFPVFIILFLLFIQPHYGTMLLLLIVFILLLFLMGYPWIRLFLIGVSISPFVFILAVFQPYRLERIKVWLNPYDYRFDKGYQLVMSFRAFKEGGLYGTDISQAIAHRYLTYGYTDFIYALIAESSGIIGSYFILILYFLIFLRAYFLIKNIKDPFIFLFASGIIILFIVQVLINISVTTGLIPTTGIGLPFISYGGSSLISYYIMMGLFLNLTKNQSYEEKNK